MEADKYVTSYKERNEKAISVLKTLNGLSYFEISKILECAISLLESNKNKFIPEILSLDVEYLTKHMNKHIKNVESVKL